VIHGDPVLIKAAVLRGPDAAYQIENVDLADPDRVRSLSASKGSGYATPTRYRGRRGPTPCLRSSPAMRVPGS
jgi:hypothetical protein